MSDNTGKQWTQADEAKLRELAESKDKGEVKLAEIAKELDRSVEACMFRAKELGLDLGMPYSE